MLKFYKTLYIEFDTTNKSVEHFWDMEDHNWKMDENGKIGGHIGYFQNSNIHFKAPYKC